MNQISAADCPANDEIEVSVFGLGVGEAITIHVGGGKWVLVDSCVPAKSSVPVALQYLGDLGVDVSTAVKLIVITHWHDDHVRGIDKVVAACVAARVSISGALLEEEFVQLADLYGGATVPDGSGVDQLAAVLRILQERKKHGVKLAPPTFAAMDRLLFQDAIPTLGLSHHVSIHALSPSDAALLRSKAAFGRLLPTASVAFNPIKAPDENESSVALVLQVGSERVLLGADLQQCADPSRGWNAVLDLSLTANPAAHVFKVPHHGAASAHEIRVWQELLVPSPIAVLTAYSRGRVPVPTDDDLNRIRSQTAHVFAASLPSRHRYKAPDKLVRDMLKGASKSIDAIATAVGHVRLRKRIDNDSPWSVDLFGAAQAL